MEKIESFHFRLSEQPDSFTSLLYTLQFTAFRITLHVLSAAVLILRLHALPIMFAYRHCVERAATVAPLLRTLRSMWTSPTRTLCNLYHLYRIISSRPQLIELPETAESSFDEGDTVNVDSIMLKRLGIQEYHNTLHEVRHGEDSLGEFLSPSLPHAAAGRELVHMPEPPKHALQPVLAPIVLDEYKGNGGGCTECVHERLGCVTCSQATRNSSVDSRIPRRVKSASEFRPPTPAAAAANEEYLKLPWRQVQAKKSGKLQKRVARC